MFNWFGFVADERLMPKRWEQNLLYVSPRYIFKRNVKQWQTKLPGLLVRVTHMYICMCDNHPMIWRFLFAVIYFTICHQIRNIYVWWTTYRSRWLITSYSISKYIDFQVSLWFLLNLFVNYWDYKIKHIRLKYISTTLHSFNIY